MILVVFGICMMVTSRLQVSRHYGLKDKGARVAGVVYVAIGLGFPPLLGAPIGLATRGIGLDDAGTAVVEVLVWAMVFIGVLVTFVHAYGNAFARQASPAAQPDED